MAFDGGIASSDSLSGSDVLSWLGQRVFTLHQTTSSLNTLSVGLGGNSDTQSLRQRLSNTEMTGQRLMDEIEKQILKSRLDFMSKGIDSTNSRALRRLEDQYSEVKLKFQEVRTASLVKRRQTEPRVESGEGLRRGASKRAPADLADNEIVFQAYSEVDAAIAEVRWYSLAVFLSISFRSDSPHTS